MCALNPPPWLPTFGWPLDGHLGHDQTRWIDNHDDPFFDYNLDINCSEFFGISSPQTAVEIDGLDAKVSPSSCEDTSSNLKKISHNANERDRRKKLNSLYSSLRSLLPLEDQKKKLSIPATVSLVLKYIPELKKQVERLTARKEEIMAQISKERDPAASYLMKGRRDAHGPLGSSPLPAISATQVDEREVVVQICTSDIMKSSFPLSEIVLKLEEEGFQLLNASSFTAVGGKAFHTLHLQVRGSVRMECGMLGDKLNSLYRKKEELHASYSDFR